MIKPVANGHISSGYGKRVRKGLVEFHHGIDIGCYEIDPIIVFPFPGEIVKSGWSDSFGWRVWQRIIGGEYNGLYAVYAHMKEQPKLKTGDIVKEGDACGIMGSSGWSDAKHLHFEIANSTGIHRTSVNPESITVLHTQK